MLPPRQCQVLRLIRRHGPTSRSNVSQSLRLHPNIAGQLVGGMIEAGILREGFSDPLGRGRPRVPLEIDPDTRVVLAATINREEASACRFNLLGQAIGNTLSRPVRKSCHPAKVAADLLSRLDSEATLGVGISVNGFINPDDPRTLLLSSVASEGGSADLSPLYDFVGERPMVLENDMHALAAQWVLGHARDAGEHILLVSIRDGALAQRYWWMAVRAIAEWLGATNWAMFDSSSIRILATVVVRVAWNGFAAVDFCGSEVQPRQRRCSTLAPNIMSHGARR